MRNPYDKKCDAKEHRLWCEGYLRGQQSRIMSKGGIPNRAWTMAYRLGYTAGWSEQDAN